MSGGALEKLFFKKPPSVKKDPRGEARSSQDRAVLGIRRKTNVNSKQEIAARGNERASLFWY
jgi:hypothetical protein